MNKKEILELFDDICNENSGGLLGMISSKTSDIIFDRLEKIEDKALSYIELNQLLVMNHVGTVSASIFKYYWCECPKHFYDLSAIETKFVFDLKQKYDSIMSCEHLHWGLYRIMMDCLFCYGDITNGFDNLRKLNDKQLDALIAEHSINTKELKQRGDCLKFKKIDPENKYLISENACKNFGERKDYKNDDAFRKFLLNNYENAKKAGKTRVTPKELINGEFNKCDDSQMSMFSLLADDIYDKEYNSREELIEDLDRLSEVFFNTRELATYNTILYLSMVNDLDVYIATSMRTKKDFLNVDKIIKHIFKNNKIIPLNLRYFDPTMSGADGHENKGLIECLMVKCSKLLIYTAGEKDSFGKDAEASMALSQGKPVIFLCENKQKADFYREVHPLARLIDFNTGVAVGAIVCEDIVTLINIVYEIFTNSLKLKLVQQKSSTSKEDGYYKIIETRTNSVFRLQTNNDLIRNSFWNFYGINKKRAREHENKV